MEDSFSKNGGGEAGGRGWFQDDSSTLHWLYILFLLRLLLCQPHPRSSGIRIWEVGDPCQMGSLQRPPQEENVMEGGAGLSQCVSAAAAPYLSLFERFP